MLEQVPFSVSLLFILITLTTYGFFVAAVLTAQSAKVKGRAHFVALALLMWIIFQSTLSLNRWYMDRDASPPHLMFPLVSTLVILSLLFLLPSGRRFLAGLNSGVLTLLHIVRIPVEIGLYLLATWKQVPWSMTFSGINFDMISGITAPIIWWLGYHKKVLPKGVLVAWNVAALALLLIVVVRGIGAVPSPIQSWDFDQPNYAVMHFPFSWLPSLIVPLVFFSHVTLLFQLLKPSSKN